MDSPISREGHRERMRASYLSGDYKNAPDHNLLELFLSIVIPRKDVKQLSYDLINEFGSLEGVISAEPEDLMRVKGIGESSAIAISCIKTISGRVQKNRNSNLKSVTSRKDAFDYSYNALINEKVECLLEVTLKADGTIINSYIVSTGVVNSTSIDMRRIVNNATKDNASSVFVAHNHPDTDAVPSGGDMNFTIILKDIFKKMDIELLDHVIVSPKGITSVFNFM